MFIFGTRSLDFPVVMFCLGPTPARTFKVSVVGGGGGWILFKDVKNYRVLLVVC